jgi:hypothetical protein
MNTNLFEKHPQLSKWKQYNKYPLLVCEKNGKTRLWACWVIKDTVYRTDGFIGGKFKEPLGHIYTGNTLRNGEEQALLEAEKLWIKQIDNNYKPQIDDEKGQEIYQYVIEQKSKNGGMNRGVKMFGETGITTKTTAGKKDYSIKHLPMLAKKYKEHDKTGEFNISNAGKSIKFPAIVQPKLDGIRAVSFINSDKQFVLESRNGNYFMHLNHIREELNYWLEHKNCTDIVLDGEMYIHKAYKNSDGEPSYDTNGTEMKSVERYQFISEACKITRKEPHDYEEMVEYWVFDIWDPTKTNIERFEILKNLFSDYDGIILKLVPSKIVNNHEEIETFMKEMIGEDNSRQGYEFEGIMVRQSSAKYSAKETHSSCLLKYKRFVDEEWEVYGAEKCVGGTQDGAIKWLCKKEINGKIKKVIAKQTGDANKAKKLYQDYMKNPKKYIGKMLNIRYNETSKDDIPRFPRAVAFVEDKY